MPHIDQFGRAVAAAALADVPRVPPTPPVLVHSSELTPLVHLYRAEVGRMTSYRQRMDSTTAWSMSTMSVLVSVMLSSQEVPHYFAIFIALVVFMFGIMEARRFAFFEHVYRRCRLFERGLFGKVLMRDAVPDDSWREELGQLYLEVPRGVARSYWDALIVRLRRHYLALLGVVYIAWLFKLNTIGRLDGGPLVWGVSGMFGFFSLFVLLVPISGVAADDEMII